MLIVLLSYSGCLSLPEQKEIITVMPATESTVVSENTNIHFTGRYCSECHEQTPVKGGDIYLKYNGDYQLLCRCHHGMSPGYCHPLDINSKFDAIDHAARLPSARREIHVRHLPRCISAVPKATVWPVYPAGSTLPPQNGFLLPLP